LTNEEELFDMVIGQGQHPRSDADTFLILEQMGCLLDEHHNDLYKKFKNQGFKGAELNQKIEENIDMEGVISEASKTWDGGFCIVGATGSGESFVFKDRWGIRPCYYYCDNEVVVAASERAAIQTAMDVKFEEIKELTAGEAITIHRDGHLNVSCITKPNNPKPCSFERIYFSRGSDAEIYRERKMLGKLLAPQIMEVSHGGFDNTVFSFIPNTAEVAYYGMIEGLNEKLNEKKFLEISNICKEEKTVGSKESEAIKNILALKVRTEKLAIKDIKMRTFIAEGSTRNDLAAHVYDITYNSIVPKKDTIAVIDDSIVRGTTLKQSIIKILSRLEPKEIVIISSSPQIRYPDCYGIDMSRMGEFIAFNAAVALIKERGMEKILSDVYKKCKSADNKPLSEFVSTSNFSGKETPAVKPHIQNFVKEIYAPFTDVEISKKIAQLVTPEGLKCDVKVVFQSIENLHKACPKNSGDWYFSGDYPTPGGTRTAIRAYINYYEGNPYKRGYSR
jgi:amidophosphoribosyltransferase